MCKFVESEQFEKLNVAVALDEGIPSETNKISVCYGERAPWWLTVTAKGPAGLCTIYTKNFQKKKLTSSRTCK